jgi:ketosteroid isomerase-like protein
MSFFTVVADRGRHYFYKGKNKKHLCMSIKIKAMEHMKQTGKRAMHAVIMIAASLIVPFKMLGADPSVHLAIGPTVENALAADDSLAKAIGDNDPDGIAHWLDKDWAVISGTGGVGEGPSIFPDGIRSGVLSRKTMELSEPRVRLFGDMALVTTKVKTSGLFQGKPFDVVERQTDVLRWENGGWKCVLTHETIISHN